jgi:hypothetical protein
MGLGLALLCSTTTGWSRPLGPELSVWGEAGLLPDLPIVPADDSGLRLRSTPDALRRALPLLGQHLILTREWTLPTNGGSALRRPINPSSYLEPRLEQPPAWQAFMRGRYGVSSWRRSFAWIGVDGPGPVGPQTDLEWEVARNLELVLPELPRSRDTEPGAPGPAEPGAEAAGCMLRKVTLVLTNGERDTLPLVDCAGAVTADAVDRVSVLARPFGVDRPPLPLPDQPDPQADAVGEWVPGVKLVHPRLLWALDRIAQRFPWRPIYVVSGYRPSDQDSKHSQGRALDIYISGVANESLFAYCRTLPDVGCGYYPNSTFVHVDVRPLRAGHAMWVDVSGPGEPAVYVDSWPGVVKRGARAWEH